MAKTVKQLTPRQVAGRANGKKGGLARAANNSKEQIAAFGKLGGKTTLAKYGRDFFSFATTKRKVVNGKTQCGRYRKVVTV